MILIVEDNEKNMKLVRDVLQAKGYKTLEAVTGEDGVRLAKEHVPQLVLMDIRLDQTDGIELAGTATAELPAALQKATTLALRALGAIQ